MRYEHPEKLEFKYNGFTFRPLIKASSWIIFALANKMSSCYAKILGNKDDKTYDYDQFYAKATRKADIFYCKEIHDYVMPTTWGLQAISYEEIRTKHI